MTNEQMIEVVRKLSISAGRYGRLFESLLSLSEYELTEWCDQFRDCTDAYEFAMRLEMVL